MNDFLCAKLPRSGRFRLPTTTPPASPANARQIEARLRRITWN